MQLLRTWLATMSSYCFVWLCWVLVRSSTGAREQKSAQWARCSEPRTIARVISAPDGAQQRYVTVNRGGSILAIPIPHQGGCAEREINSWHTLSACLKLALQDWPLGTQLEGSGSAVVALEPAFVRSALCGTVGTVLVLAEFLVDSLPHHDAH